MSKICLTLPGPDARSNISAMVDNQGCFQAVELRLDVLNNPVEEARLFFSALGKHNELMQAISPVNSSEDSAPSVIVTLRRVDDGGVFSESWEEGQRLLLSVLDGLVDTVLAKTLGRSSIAVDVEIETQMPEVFQRVRSLGYLQIRSIHQFDRTPEDLFERLEDLASQGDIPKLACMVGGLEDSFHVFQAGRKFSERHPDTPFILVGMGEYGMPSRILPEKSGSCLTFASAGTPMAPGQIGCRELTQRYRRLRPGHKTVLFGIVGNPVSHSKSPDYHNGRFRRAGVDAVYIPLLCDEPADLFPLAELLDIRGMSVTIPYKQAIREFLDDEDKAVGFIGACNTLWKSGGRWHGGNSDAPGFLKPVEVELAEVKRRFAFNSRPSSTESSGSPPIDSEEQIPGATVIGAGGASRAVVYALLDAGFRVLILNRNADRASLLAREMAQAFPRRVRTAALSEASIPEVERHRSIVVQTTSVGMHSGVSDVQPSPQENEAARKRREPAVPSDEHRIDDPMPFYTFHGDELVYDIIYTPPATKFLRRAQEAGCKTINGQGMFDAQAELQSQRFLSVLG